MSAAEPTADPVECDCGRRAAPETAYAEWYVQDGTETAIVCPDCREGGQ